MRRKRATIGRERQTVRNSCSKVVIWTLSVGFWNSYAEWLNLNMSVSVHVSRHAFKTGVLRSLRERRREGKGGERPREKG